MADTLEGLRASLEREIRTLRGAGAPEPPSALLDLAVEQVALPGGDVEVVRPRSWGDLREEEALARRPVPYWALLWPSGTVLAEEIAGERVGGLRVLELGCGLALPSVAAARGGASVLATDGSSDAIAFAAHVLALNGLAGEVAQVDWQSDGDALAARGPFDLVLAADVLYTQANVDLALDLVPRLLAPGGAMMLADPGRRGGASFLAAAEGRWQTTVVSRGDVSVARLRSRPPASG